MGSDTLTGPDGTNTWFVTGQGAGTLNGISSFQEVESLTGGSGNDTFQLSNGVAVSGIINGGTGSNTLDYAACSTPVRVVLASGSATGLRHTSAGGFSNIQAFVGGSASDTLVGPNGSNIWNIT